MDAVKTDVGAAKPTLSPFAKNKNLIELKVFFLVILHLDLCPGKVWEFSIFFILHTSRRNFWITALKLVNVTYKILNEKEAAMSEKGNYVLAILKTSENYDNLKESLSDLT